MWSWDHRPGHGWNTKAKSVKSQYPHLWNGFQEGGKRKPVGAELFPPFFKGRSLITFHIDGINETLQQRLLKYFSALESILYFHVALVQEFSVTQEKAATFWVDNLARKWETWVLLPYWIGPWEYLVQPVPEMKSGIFHLILHHGVGSEHSKQ